MKQNKLMRKAIQEGKKLQKQQQKHVCVACNGSGRYDVSGSPKCSSCNGTGYSK